MRVAFVIYDRVHVLDFLPLYGEYIKSGARVDICAFRDVVKDDGVLKITPTKVCEPLDDYDVVVVGGGEGVKFCCDDEIFLAWLRSSRYAKRKIAVGEGVRLFERIGFDDFEIKKES